MKKLPVVLFVAGCCTVGAAATGLAAQFDFDKATLFQGGALATWSGSLNNDVVSASATYTSSDSVIVNVPFHDELASASSTYPDYSAFSNYQVNLTLTNNTNEVWTDFHLAVGFISREDGMPDQFEPSSGVDQPLKITAPSPSIFQYVSVINSTNIVDPDRPDYGAIPNGDIGVNWWGGSIGCGGSVTLGFNISVGDTGSQTNFNWNGQTHDIAFSFTPTYASPVPEPATMLLFGVGLVGLAAAGRRRKL